MTFDEFFGDGERDIPGPSCVSAVLWFVIGVACLAFLGAVFVWAVAAELV